ncbi:insulin-like growth factor-binding protein-related protein 1 [Asterias amurensis]|uniref:insulin-like growth factor-binding protein-related protein 1 n=1 Tax=Asterias amurensis TaxID=7602 RepID=UPI003AB24BB6
MGYVMWCVSFCVLLVLLQDTSFAQDADESLKFDDKPSVGVNKEECSCEGVVCEPLITKDKCPHGLVPDTREPCQCCNRCGNGEYEFCDQANLTTKELADKKHNFGICGRGMECRANYDVHPGADPETVCFCVNKKLACGSDGVTYETACLLEKIAFESGSGVIKERHGRCKGAPVVATEPDDVTNSTVGNVYLQCEILGNPVPRVEWRKIGPNGHPGEYIPQGSGDRYTVQTRGGPEEYEVTGWLQITRLEVDDAGEYECVGINKFGEASGRGSIFVEE